MALNPGSTSGEITGKRPCDGLRVDLKRCLLQSDCCLHSKKTPLECLQTNEVSSECQVSRLFSHNRADLVVV